MKKGALIIIILLVLIIIAGAVYFFFLNKPVQTAAAPTPTVEPKKYMFTPGEYFVTNVKDSTSLLKTAITFEINQEGKEEFLTANKNIIRDVIIFTLREKTEQELRALNIQDKLRVEIVEKVKEKLKVDYIQTLYFNDYVLQ